MKRFPLFLSSQIVVVVFIFRLTSRVTHPSSGGMESSACWCDPFRRAGGAGSQCWTGACWLVGRWLCLIMCWLAAAEPDWRSFSAAIWTSAPFTLISACLTNLTHCLTSSAFVKHADWLNDRCVTDVCTWQTVLDWRKPTSPSLRYFWRLNPKGRQQRGKFCQ